MSLAPVDSCRDVALRRRERSPGNPSLVPGCGAPLSPFVFLRPKVRAYTRARLKPGPKDGVGTGTGVWDPGRTPD